MPFIRKKANKSRKDITKRSGLRATIFEGKGESYTGEWKNDLKYGFGTQKWVNKNLVYTGYWKNGKRYGDGMLYPLDKEDAFTYNGGWMNDKRSGHGFQNYKDGGKYDGQWAKDRRHGFGTMRYSDGSVYEGTWHKDKRSGVGTITFADGSVYSGDWKKDKQNGQGVLTTKKENVYRGEWKNGMKHGEGSYFSRYKEVELDGVWIHDIPRCGILEIINRDIAMNPMKYDIPECTLREPQRVIQNAKEHYLENTMKDEDES